MASNNGKKPLRKAYARDRETNQYVKNPDGKFFREVYTVWPQFPDKRNVQMDLKHPYFQNPDKYYLDERDADWTGKAKAPKDDELNFT